MIREKYLIINADDFGASTGVNRGIPDCHTRGVVTSTSFMVTGAATREAIAMSRDHPALAIGLHWDVWGEDEGEFDLTNVAAVRDEFRRQLGTFQDWFGRMPTHVDSHRHAHRKDHLMPVFQELVEPLRIPLRDDGRVIFVGGFYAQWEWKVTNLEYVSVPFLERMIRTEVPVGFTEFSCHPGYVSNDYYPVYRSEREAEVRTLTNRQIRQTIADQGIRLISYADYGCLQQENVRTAS